jgi:DNA-binding TFAR19-related protein (PDSD5 family)
LVKSDVSGGRIIEYVTKAHIGGAADPRADAEARKAAYREHEAYSAKACHANPDAVERLTGSRLSADQRAESVRKCLKAMAKSRDELVREGLIEP